MARLERLSISPGGLKTLWLLNAQIDVTPILPTVQVPTLVVHRRKDARVPIELGSDLAAQIPDAKFIDYPGSDHWPLATWRPYLVISRSLSLDIAMACHPTRTCFGHRLVYRHRRFYTQGRRNGRPSNGAYFWIF